MFFKNMIFFLYGMQNLIIYKENFLFVIGKKPCFYSSVKLDIKQLHIKKKNKIFFKISFK